MICRKCALAFLLCVAFAVAGNSVRKRPLRLIAAVAPHVFEDSRYNAFVETLEKSIEEYGVGELLVGFQTDLWLTYSEFPKIRRTVDEKRLAAFREQLQRFRRRGLPRTGSDPHSRGNAPVYTAQLRNAVAGTGRAN
jgi:hypothetical protein